MASWTTADLLASIKARANFPDATANSLSPAVLLNFCTEELHSKLVPMIMAVREQYYATYLDTVIVSGNPLIAIPTRAIGGTLDVVQFIYNQTVVALSPLAPSQVVTTTTAGTPQGYYYENNNIHLDPTPSGTGGTIRMRYFQRPSRLEQTVNCAQITAVSSGALTVTSGSVPSTWTTGTVVDFIPATIPYTPYGLSTSITGISSGVVSFAAFPTNLVTGATITPAVGDWLALAEYTPIPEIPFEFQPMLSQMGVIRGLAAGNDQSGLQAAREELGEYHKAAVSLITPRNQSSPKKITSNWGRF